jgi:hypothetical protein
VHRQDHRLTRQLDDRFKLLQRIKIHSIEVRIAGHGVGGNQDGVAIRRALGGSFDADRRVGTRFVLDVDLLAEDPREILANQPRAHVGRTAGREWHDDAHGPGRPLLRARHPRRRDGQRDERKEHGQYHRKILLPLVSTSIIVSALVARG